MNRKPPGPRPARRNRPALAPTLDAMAPNGQRVSATTTGGATARYRAGVPVEIWHHHAGVFRVFVGGRFVGGWASRELAAARAARY